MLTSSVIEVVHRKGKTWRWLACRDHPSKKRNGIKSVVVLLETWYVLRPVCLSFGRPYWGHEQTHIHHLYLLVRRYRTFIYWCFSFIESKGTVSNWLSFSFYIVTVSLLIRSFIVAVIRASTLQPMTAARHKEASNADGNNIVMMLCWWDDGDDLWNR